MLRPSSIAVALVLAASGGVYATDLPQRKSVLEPRGCLAAHRSPILDMATQPLMRGAVDERMATAVAVAGEPATLADPSPLFTWANETKAYCGMAVGYFDGGEVNEAMVTKCDCFYERMQRFREGRR